jgi:myosin heavy subunit
MLYASVFAWVVDKVNRALIQQTAAESSRRKQGKDGGRFIGVLDIYG